MKEYQLVIVGAGPAGLTAGIYAGRARIKTLVIDKLGYGGQMLLIDAVENFPGFPEAINGFELAKKMYDQMIQFGTEHKVDDVKEIKKINEGFSIKCDEETYFAKSIILAIGSKPRKLDAAGETEFIGKGVSYCAVCDGNFFKGKEVAVVGGGNSALEEAEYLSRIASKVTVIHRRDQLRADKILQERAKNNKKIVFAYNSVVDSIQGEGKVSKVVLKDVKTNKLSDINVSAVFVLIGQIPQTEIFRGLIDVDEKGFILTDSNFRTSVKGVFASGDCRRREFWQLVVASAEGAQAVHNALEYLA
ncbi:MAG: thioredoxin-disulfide reductase [bacterium]